MGTLHLARIKELLVISYMILGESRKIKMIEAYWWVLCGVILLKNMPWRGLGLVQRCDHKLTWFAQPG
jgi:hypothetical protein